MGGPAFQPPTSTAGLPAVPRTGGSTAGRTGGFTGGSEVPPVGTPVYGGVLWGAAGSRGRGVVEEAKKEGGGSRGRGGRGVAEVARESPIPSLV